MGNLWTAHAQKLVNQDKISIQLLGKAYQDSIVLRWAPENPELWRLGNEYGYIIERAIIKQNNQLIEDIASTKEVIVSSLNPVKLQKLQNWKPYIEDDYVFLGAAAIYDDSFLTEIEGNDMVSLYNQTKQEYNRFMFALWGANNSQQCADLAGLRFVDKNVEANTEYYYQVYINLPEKSRQEIDTGKIIVDSGKLDKLVAPTRVQVYFRNNVADISWENFYSSKIFIGYFVERSLDGVNYERLESAPMPVSYEDDQPSARIHYHDSVDNSSTYHYRVRGITPFAELSPPSKVVSGKNQIDIKQINPKIIQINPNSSEGIELTWEFPEKYHSVLKGFQVVKALQQAGPYQAASDTLPPTQFSYQDKAILGTSYYMIRALDTLGNMTYSVPHLVQPMDSIPPAAPIEIEGKIDSLGVVHLHWKLNEEPDLYGYRVFRANSRHEEFIQVSKELIQDTVFTDTVSLNTLTPKVYYKLFAVDFRYNSSKYSEVVAIKRPDTIPPIAPLLQNYEVFDTAIVLKWVPSHSSDVVQHQLWRRNFENSPWIEIERWDSLKIEKLKQFQDSAIVPGRTYTYRFVAIDDSDNQAFSEPIQIETIDRGIRKAVQKFEGKVDRKNRKIILSWDYPTTEVIERIVLYRAKKEEAFRAYKAILPSESIFQDKNLKINTIYKYKLQVFFQSGSQSRLSKTLELRY